jgi:hypothetical protein
LSTQEATINGEAINLFTITDEHNQVSSVVPIRWCISRETAEEIQEKEIDDPQLLLVVTKNGTEMNRYVVPLTDMMHYIQFRSPGENIVHATIVWKNGDEKPRKVLTARYDNGTYRADVVSKRRPNFTRIEKALDKLKSERRSANDEEEESRIRSRIDLLRGEQKAYIAEKRETLIRNDFDGVSQLGEEAQLGVLVPEEMFAKKPPAWMTWLGTRYKFPGGAARDECDLRRRALFTVVSSPIVAVAAVIIAVIVLCGLVGVALLNLLSMIPLSLLGMRGMKWSFLWPPGNAQPNPEKIWKASKPSVWWYKAKKDSKGVTYEARAPFIQVFNPGTVMMAAGLGTLFGWALGSIPYGIYFALAGLVVLAVIVAIVASGPAKNWFAERRELREKAEEEVLSHELELLACTSQSREVSLRALPKERRTITLRFQALKANVCKPFAR